MGYSEHYIDGAHDDCHLGKIGMSAGISEQLGVGWVSDPVASLVAKAEVPNGCDDVRAASVVRMVSGEYFASTLDDPHIVALKLSAFAVERQRANGEFITARSLV
jgi:hypothetical protein